GTAADRQAGEGRDITRLELAVGARNAWPGERKRRGEQQGGVGELHAEAFPSKSGNFRRTVGQPELPRKRFPALAPGHVVGGEWVKSLLRQCPDVLKPGSLDAPGRALYTSAFLTDARPGAVPRSPWALALRIEDHVAALRTDRQRAFGRPQGQPLEHQDQAPVHAEPVQRDADVRHARPLSSRAGVGERAEVGRSPWRPRRLPAQGEGYRARAAHARAQACDREEAGREGRRGVRRPRTKTDLKHAVPRGGVFLCLKRPRADLLLCDFSFCINLAIYNWRVAAQRSRFFKRPKRRH